MLEWMVMPLKRYADFSGRSRRKEYWAFFMLNIVVIGVLLALSLGMGAGASLMEGARSGPLGIYSALFSGVGILIAVWWLAVLIPNIAVNVRRLHDRDMSGWWYLGLIVLSLVPIIGFLVGIVYLVMMCLEGTKGTNRFGADPKGGGTSPDVFN